MSRRSVEKMIAEIYAGTGADLDELAQLRARIDDAKGNISDHEGGLVAALCKSFDVSRLLVEEGILSTRHRSAAPVPQGQLQAVVEANVAYLQRAMQAYSEPK